MSNAIFEILGALDAAGEPDETAGVRAATELVKFAADIQALCGEGKESFSAQLSELRSLAALAREVHTATDNATGGAIGIVLAWKASHEERPKLEEQIAELKKSTQSRDLNDLLERGKAEGKLTPATAAFWEAKADVESLREFLKVATRAIPGEKKPPSAAVSDLGVNALGAATLANGKAYEDLSAKELADLRGSEGGEDLYQAIRADWIKRGKPRKAA
jgi:hypothetical protein